MKNLLLFLTIIFLSYNLYSQTTINDYKYVIVPSAYEFLGEKDKYQLNSLTKFLFNKYGFTAFLDDEPLPQDLKDNGCLGMKAELEDKKGFLKTKVQFHLKDCAGQIIMSSKVGDTKEKMMDKSYNLALREAFETFMDVNYKYNPKTKTSTAKTSNNLDLPEATIEKIEEEHKETKRLVEAVNDEPDATKVEDEIMPVEQEQPEVSANLDLLYAQPIENGFQIVDTEPKKVMILYYSGLNNVFIVKDKNAIVYKNGEQWIYSHIDGTLKSKELNIKF